MAHKDVSPDETVKYLMRQADGLTIESVYLPYPERVSVCLSTQVGCAGGLHVLRHRAGRTGA